MYTNTKVVFFNFINYGLKYIISKSLAFYLDFFRYGCPEHGKFAIGIARIMMQMFNIDNIREATFIYRGPTRLNP